MRLLNATIQVIRLLPDPSFALFHNHALQLLWLAYCICLAESRSVDYDALTRLHEPKAIEIISGATHLFPEPGAMEAVIEHAGQWFERYLQAPGSVRAAS